MTIDFQDFLPQHLSDETAYYIVNFFSELTAALETEYFAQMRQYVEDNVANEL